MNYSTVILLLGLFFVNNIIDGRKLPNPLPCVRILSRTDWGANYSTNVEYQVFPVANVIICHTVTNTCDNMDDCKNIVHSIQGYHQRQKRFGDIAYNFLIGNDGNIYEGVGWHRAGTHTPGYNSKSIAIAFIGNFDRITPSDKAVRIAKKLLECGVETGELEENYKLLGARQVSNTKSPGLLLYQDIQTWSHWVPHP